MRNLYPTIIFLIFASFMLLLVSGCQKAPPGPSATEVSSSVQLGKRLFALLKEKKHEEAVIALRHSLKGLYKKQCMDSFLKEGGIKEEWNLLFQAAQSSEFDAGKNYGNKLQAKELQDADVVEYIKGALRNAPDFKKLAFSAGFISTFQNKQIGLDHLDTLWIWAMPQ